MNRWQEIFLDHYYGGKMPADKRGLKQYELLGMINNTVTVHFPKMEGVNGIKPAHAVTYTVRENECNMRRDGGIIAATVLSWQILCWAENGYLIETDAVAEKTA